MHVLFPDSAPPVDRAGLPVWMEKGLRLLLLPPVLTLIGMLVSCLLPLDAFAHERWILSDGQILEWSEKPNPALWREIGWINGVLLFGFSFFTAGWIWLGFTGARELFPDLQARLSSYGYLVAPIIRFCLAWLLISSSFGLEPRASIEPMTSPTLFAPDLELSMTFPKMLWLRWLEFGLGIAFLLGIYVRLCAAILLFLTFLGALLFQSAIYAYGGALVGVGLYLLFQGAGSYYLPFPTHPEFLEMQKSLSEVPRSRAQAIMRILTGINIFYLAVAFKVMQPNLTIAILTLHHISFFGLPLEVTTLVMTLVEFTAGILMMAGILLRPLALFLLGAFLIFAAILPESWMSHALFYGVMFSFLFNGAGRFAMPEAKDKKARIVVIGGTVAGIHAAIKIERLIGTYSHVELTLLTDQPNVLFYPLLPEVIGGTMQPGNAVNPIRRILTQTRVLLGEVQAIDSHKRMVSFKTPEGTERTLNYDQLVLAQFLIPNLNRYPGLMAHASPINAVGDALHIRKQIMNRVEQAELEESPKELDRLLSFAVIGSGQRACGTAEEIAAMLNVASTSYPVLTQHGWRVHLFEDTRIPFSDFEADIRPKIEASLERAGVTICKDQVVKAITQDSVVLEDGQRIPVGYVVNSCFMMPSIRIDEEVRIWPLATDASLKVVDYDHIFAAAAPPSLVDRDGQRRRYLTTSDWMDLGRMAGQNAWAASQDFDHQPFSFKQRLVIPFNMGRQSIARVIAITLTGLPAWFLSRMSNLLTMPGLERNLRILIDWTLDVPFRADIAVLAPELSSRLQVQHFEAGDEVVRQGETGDTAYVVRSGELEVIRSGKSVGTLSPGDFFGEVALLKHSKRTATVRCLGPCELSVFAREDFEALSIGSSALAKAIREQAASRNSGTRKRSSKKEE